MKLQRLFETFRKHVNEAEDLERLRQLVALGDEEAAERLKRVEDRISLPIYELLERDPERLAATMKDKIIEDSENGKEYWGVRFPPETTKILADKVVLSKSIGDYQGERLMIIQRQGKIGFFTESYGSCSHCDYYQDLSDKLRDVMRSLEGGDDKPLDDLIKGHISYLQRLNRRIHWFEDPEELVNHLSSEEARGRWEWHLEQYAPFVEELAKKFGVPFEWEYEDENGESYY